MKNHAKIRKLVVLSVLSALIFVLQMLGNIFGKLFANGLALALVPIAIGALLYGARAGALLGLVMSAAILVYPENYVAIGPFAMNGFEIFKLIIIILIKSPLAGFVCGSLFSLFFKRGMEIVDVKKRISFLTLGMSISALMVVLVNTGTYVLLMLLFFTSGNGFTLAEFNNYLGDSAFQNGFLLIILGFVGFNFVIELLITFVLSPAINYIIHIITRRYDMGYKYNFIYFNERS